MDFRDTGWEDDGIGTGSKGRLWNQRCSARDSATTGLVIAWMWVVRCSYCANPLIEYYRAENVICLMNCCYSCHSAFSAFHCVTTIVVLWHQRVNLPYLPYLTYHTTPVSPFSKWINSSKPFI
jgi:hypothetical protein